MSYQPKTGERCTCKRGIQRDNCPACEGTGWLINFRAIRERPTRAQLINARYDKIWESARRLNPEKFGGL